MRGDPASDRVWTVPNLLSAARFALSVIAFWLIARQAWAAATVVFVVAASTDSIDGWYARKFNQISRLGRIFDPLVDKILVCGAFILVAVPAGPIQPWMAVLVVVRELVVTALRAELERAGTDFSATLAGKLKMVLQCVAVGLVLAARAWPELAPEPVTLATAAGWATWAAVISTVWSGLEYLWAARSLVR
ncbi:MAG: CDP-diacylglycerol--glycerol-3-phosphate 3-phosphatidyltransferase [Planctomycetota bacterium]